MQCLNAFKKGGTHMGLVRKAVEDSPDVFMSYMFHMCRWKNSFFRLKAHKELLIELVPKKIYSWCHGSSNPWRDDLGATA